MREQTHGKRERREQEHGEREHPLLGAMCEADAGADRDTERQDEVEADLVVKGPADDEDGEDRSIASNIGDEEETLQQLGRASSEFGIEAWMTDKKGEGDEREGPVQRNDAGETCAEKVHGAGSADHGHDEAADDEEDVDPEGAYGVPGAETELGMEVHDGDGCEGAEHLNTAYFSGHDGLGGCGFVRVLPGAGTSLMILGA